MLSRIRNRVDELTEPTARVFARAGFTPNLLTSLGLLLGIAAAFFFAGGQVFLAGSVLLACGFFDLMDGAVARITGRETGFGGVLDSVADRYVDFAIFAGIIYGGLAGAWGLSWFLLGALAMVGSFMVSYTRARAESAGTGRLDVGLAERGERLLILIVGAFLGAIEYSLAIIAILTHLTVVQRLAVAKTRL